MATIHVTDLAGVTHDLEAPEGWRVMEVIRDYGLGIIATCGGACACAACHVLVEEAWVDRVPEPRDDEIERLDEVPEVEDGGRSRLSCQILVSDETDGLHVTLTPSSVEVVAQREEAA